MQFNVLQSCPVEDGGTFNRAAPNFHALNIVLNIFLIFTMTSVCYVLNFHNDAHKNQVVSIIS